MNVTYDKVDTFPSVPNDPISYSDLQTLVFGTTDFTQNNQVFRESRVNSDDVTYDLTSGGLYNVFGQQINFSTINYLIIKNTDAETDILITAGTAGAFFAYLTPGGVLYLAGDDLIREDPPANITITSQSSATASWDIIVIGVQA